MTQALKPKLRIINMTKLYDNGDGVRNINLDVYPGEIVTMLGPSGCGKTTILRTIAGFLDINGGDITIDDQSIAMLPPEKRPTAMVFQSYNLWPHMPVYENLAFGLKLRKIPRKEIDRQIENILNLVSMTGFEKQYPAQMSGGQQQRIAIARSLLLRPEVLLMDEPFSALDAKIRGQMREELVRIQTKLGITVVFVTHDQEEAMAISHRIVVMNKGVFEQVGSPMEVYDCPATRYVADFIGEMNFIQNPEGFEAVRPELITILAGHGKGRLDGQIRTIMVLGHYVEVNVQAKDQVIKCFVQRDKFQNWGIGDDVSLQYTAGRIFQQNEISGGS